MNKKNLNEHRKDASDAFGYIGLVFEFLGILALLPILGYLADRYLLGKETVSWFFGIGLAVGFSYGLFHLYRRAKSIVFPVSKPKSATKKMSREGYPENLDREVDRLRGELDDVGKRIDDLHRTKKNL